MTSPTHHIILREYFIIAILPGVVVPIRSKVIARVGEMRYDNSRIQNAMLELEVSLVTFA